MSRCQRSPRASETFCACLQPRHPSTSWKKNKRALSNAAWVSSLPCLVAPQGDGMRPQHHRQEKQVGYVILEVPKGLGSTQGTRRLGVSSGCTVNTDGFSLHGSRKSVALVTAADTAARPPAAPDSFSTGSRKNPVAGGRAGPGPKLGEKNKKKQGLETSPRLGAHPVGCRARRVPVLRPPSPALPRGGRGDSPSAGPGGEREVCMCQSPVCFVGLDLPLFA